MLTFQINVERPPHICSLDCISHPTAPFLSVLDAAQQALEDLFTPEETVLAHIQGQLPYPTHNHVHFSRIIGLMQSHLYFTDMLLSDEKCLEVTSHHHYFCNANDILHDSSLNQHELPLSRHGCNSEMHVDQP